MLIVKWKGSKKFWKNQSIYLHLHCKPISGSVVKKSNPCFAGPGFESRDQLYFLWKVYQNFDVFLNIHCFKHTCHYTIIKFVIVTFYIIITHQFFSIDKYLSPFLLLSKCLWNTNSIPQIHTRSIWNGKYFKHFWVLGYCTKRGRKRNQTARSNFWVFSY